MSSKQQEVVTTVHRWMFRHGAVATELPPSDATTFAIVCMLGARDLELSVSRSYASAFYRVQCGIEDRYLVTVLSEAAACACLRTMTDTYYYPSLQVQQFRVHNACMELRGGIARAEAWLLDCIRRGDTRAIHRVTLDELRAVGAALDTASSRSLRPRL